MKIAGIVGLLAGLIVGLIDPAMGLAFLGVFILFGISVIADAFVKSRRLLPVVILLSYAAGVVITGIINTYFQITIVVR